MCECDVTMTWLDVRTSDMQTLADGGRTFYVQMALRNAVTPPQSVLLCPVIRLLEQAGGCR
jgi:hypothetical protein